MTKKADDSQNRNESLRKPGRKVNVQKACVATDHACGWIHVDTITKYH